MTQKITAIFGAFIFAAILMGTLALAPNAYALINPLAVPPSITTSLFPGELGQFPTTIDPQLEQLPQGFSAVLFNVEAGSDCIASGFIANISLFPTQIGPTQFDFQWVIQPNGLAAPGEYTCTGIWTVLYIDPNGIAFPESVGQLLTVTVLSPTIDVDVDIKPGSDPNSINVNKKKGVTPVAILGSASFDVTDIYAATLTFGPSGASTVHDLSDALVLAEHQQDVNEDGFLDLVAHFSTPDTGIAPGDTEACIAGQSLDTIVIIGCDSVRTVPTS